MTIESPLLQIRTGDRVLSDAEIAILVPADAPSSPSKLAGLIAGSQATAKHAFHALSEIALYDFEDQALCVEEIPEGEALSVWDGSCETSLEQGMILVRNSAGKVQLFAHDNVDHYRLLKFAHRHCTRWIRLDI